MGCQRVELSVFWKPSNAMNTGSLFFFFFAWQIKLLFLRGKYYLCSVPIYPGYKKSCVFSMSLVAYHS